MKTLAFAIVFLVGLVLGFLNGRGKPPAANISSAAGNQAYSNLDRVGNIAATFVSGSPTEAIGLPSTVARENVRLGSLEWQSIESTNYLEFIGNLKKIGCPESIIRDIVVSDLEYRYSQETNAIGREYWKDSRAKIEALRNANIAARKNVLEMSGLSGSPTLQETQISEIETKYRRLMADANDQRAVAHPANTQQSILALERQRFEELSKILSPQALEEYKHRNSELSQQLVGVFDPMNLSEREFISIYKIREAQQLLQSESGNERSPLQLSQALANTYEELRKELGEERYGQYILALNPGYRDVVEVVGALNLPNETVTKVFAIRDSMRERFSGADSSQFPDLEGTTRSRLVSVLGEEAVRKLSERGIDRSIFGYSLSR